MKTMERISREAALGLENATLFELAKLAASRNAFAIAQLPVAKNPCRNSIFFCIVSFIKFFYLSVGSIYGRLINLETLLDGGADGGGVGIVALKDGEYRFDIFILVLAAAQLRHVALHKHRFLVVDE